MNNSNQNSRRGFLYNAALAVLAFTLTSTSKISAQDTGSCSAGPYLPVGTIYPCVYGPALIYADPNNPNPPFGC